MGANFFKQLYKDMFKPDESSYVKGPPCNGNHIWGNWEPHKPWCQYRSCRSCGYTQREEL